MDMVDKITNLLVTNCGTLSYPTGDGRIEVPQTLLRLKEFCELEQVFIGIRIDDEMVISESKHGFKKCSSAAVSDGRVRVPASFLKENDLYKKALNFIEFSGGILIRANNSNNFDKIKDILSTVPKETLRELHNCVVNPNNTCSPYLFLLSVDSPFVFTPTGNPFKFKAKFRNKSLFLSNGGEVLYLLPGIRKIRGDLLMGYLLLDSHMFGKIIKRYGEKLYQRELVFIHAPFSYGNYMMYINPPREYSKGLISLSQKFCNDPYTFIESKFNEEGDGEFKRLPMSVNADTIIVEDKQ